MGNIFGIFSALPPPPELIQMLARNAPWIAFAIALVIAGAVSLAMIAGQRPKPGIDKEAMKKQRFADDSKLRKRGHLRRV